jgi:hypothetical protein
MGMSGDLWAVNRLGVGDGGGGWDYCNTPYRI